MVMTFSEKPAEVIAISDNRIEVGIELPTIREAFTSPKKQENNNHRDTTARIMVTATSFKESRIVSAESFTISIVRSESSAVRVSMVSFTGIGNLHGRVALVFSDGNGDCFLSVISGYSSLLLLGLRNVRNILQHNNLAG